MGQISAWMLLLGYFQTRLDPLKSPLSTGVPTYMYICLRCWPAITETEVQVMEAEAVFRRPTWRCGRDSERGSV